MLVGVLNNFAVEPMILKKKQLLHLKLKTLLPDMYLCFCQYYLISFIVNKVWITKCMNSCMFPIWIKPCPVNKTVDQRNLDYTAVKMGTYLKFTNMGSLRVQYILNHL